jgi:hypothetical protein
MPASSWRNESLNFEVKKGVKDEVKKGVKVDITQLPFHLPL